MKAWVAKGVWSHKQFTVHTIRGDFAINCGNGVDEGTVHIELKHNVENWNNALACIERTINRGTEHDNGSKKNYSYNFKGGTVIVVTGSGKVITAYPTGDDRTLPGKWAACSRS